MNIKLLPFKQEYLAKSLKWRSQSSTVTNNAIANISNDELLKSHLSEGVKLSMLGAYKKFRWFIEFDGQIVGMVSLRSIDLNAFIGEIGYGVDEKFQGRGIATKAVKSVVTMIFSETQLRRITAHVFEKNMASIRVLEKVGFIKEGFLREHHLINGQPGNAVSLAILKSDWQALF